LTTPQILSMLSWFGTIIGTWMISHNHATTASWNEFWSTFTTFVGGAIPLATLAWSMYRTRKQGIVNSAAALPEVKTINATPDVAKAAPSDKVVSHG